MGRWWKEVRRKNDDRGLGTLELVIVFPVLFTFILFDIQVAMYHYARQVFLAAAAEGARVSAAGGDGKTAANNLLSYSGGSWVNGSASAPMPIYDTKGNKVGLEITVSGSTAVLTNVTFKVSQSSVLYTESFTHG